MYKFGIDIGGTGIKAGLIKDGNIIDKGTVPTKSERPYADIISDAAALCVDVLKANGLRINDIKGVGVGMPGCIDEEGTVIYSNNIPWKNVPLGSELSKLLKLPVKVENDANVAGLGENIYGAGSKYKDSILLTLGTGVGAGIVIDGKIFSGYRGAGAELGHIVIAANGEQCSCGRKGCLEAYASATALIRDTKKLMLENSDTLMWELAGTIENVQGRTSFDAAKLGDKPAQKIVDTYIDYLSEGIVNVVNAFRPQAIILGGGVSAAGDFFLNPLKKLCFERVYGSTGYAPFDIVIASLGNDAGIIGAAELF